ncbi:MAG: hypothetical protein ABI823_00970 [Bryobacteraceae bacterium]
MVRAVASSLLSLLLTATLFYGGCVACPQFFMFPGANAKKDCCKADRCDSSKTAKAPKAVSKECKRMPMDSSHATDLHFDLSACEGLPSILSPTIVAVGDFAAPTSEPTGHSPPDVLAFLATFLI